MFYTYINLWNTMKFGFQHKKQELEKNQISTGCPIINLGPKHRFFLKIDFF